MRPDTHRKKPLFRKVNTRTHGVRHGLGGEARWERNTNATQGDDRTQGSMHSHHKHGRDYTPLFRFLLSRVGRSWDETHREAVARLDTPDPIFWMVALTDADAQDVVRTGENSYFSGLYVDANGLLARVNPALCLDDMKPACTCCTHTFNGERFTRAFDGTGG